MSTERDTALPVIRKGYDFHFDYNGLAFRAGVSAITGREYVYVNEALVSTKKSRAELSTHDFTVSGTPYRIEFEVLSKVNASLACRLYCNNTLVKLFAATPKRLWLTKPLFAAGIILALLIHDAVVTAIPMTPVLAGLAALLALDVSYPMRHIQVMELGVQEQNEP